MVATDKKRVFSKNKITLTENVKIITMKKTTMKNSLLFTVISVVFFVLSACSSAPHDTLSNKNKNQALKQTYFNIEFLSFDGTKIKATVFQPELKAGETAPLIIHAHGLAAFRMSAPISTMSQLVITGQAARKAWKNGYWVISYDQRGHGASGGTINIMDPQREVRDVTAVIDWAQKNLSRISYDQKDPIIGMVGESYGGQAQLLSATLDHRIDAIVPFNTWNNLETALYPNRVPKSGWLTTLVFASNIMSMGRMDPMINKAYVNARKGFVPPEVFNYLEDHAFNYYCEKGQIPKADVFMIQGFRDVLFPINEATKNYHCLKQSGKDIRFMGTQGGHILPLAQFSMIPGFQVESTVHCDNQKIDLREAVVSWFDEKLKKKEGAAKAIPLVCLTHDTQSGTVFSDIPTDGQTFSVGQAEVKSGFAGFFELPMGIIDRITAVFRRDEPKVYYGELNTSGGTLRPAFIPLTVTEEAGTIVGIPTAELEIETSNSMPHPILFLSVGIKRKNSDKITILNEQVTPIKGTGSMKVELAGISSKLKKGDILGLVVQSYSNQFRLSRSGWRTEAKVSGKIILPIQKTQNRNTGMASHFASSYSLENTQISGE
jgi:ABC-2 type transport system ATP-binding protein